MALAGAQRGGRSAGGDLPDGVQSARKSKLKDRHDPVPTLGLMKSSTQTMERPKCTKLLKNGIGIRATKG